RGKTAEPLVGLQRVMQPTAYKIAGRPPARQHFVVTSAAAKVTRPTSATRLLEMNVARRQPRALSRAVNAGFNAAHVTHRITDKSVTGSQVAIRGNAKVPGTGAAGVRAMCAAMQLAQRIDHVQKGVAITAKYLTLEGKAARDHSRQHLGQVLLPH